MNDGTPPRSASTDRRRSIATVSLALSTALAACAAPTPATNPGSRLIGGEHDEHGCIAPAGYRWCSRENACVRPWELAAKAGFQNDESAFRQYCESTSN